MRTFDILSKGRKYFKATTDGYKCRILIDEASETLNFGEQTIEVEDISIRSKYGTDLIFKLPEAIEDQETNGIVSLHTDYYNTALIARCRELNGQWDENVKSWIFSSIAEKEVELLDEKYNSKKVSIEIKFLKDVEGFNGAVNLGGFDLAVVYSKKSKLQLCNGAVLIYGSIYNSGGIQKWSTVINRYTVLRIRVPEKCIDDMKNDTVEISKLIEV